MAATALISISWACQDDSAGPEADASTDDGGEDAFSPPEGEGGSTSDGDSDGGSETGDDTGPLDGVGRAGMRRLTRYEFDNAVRDILGDDSRPLQSLLPEEGRTPF
ncbi:MAG: DUF1587 domain-containing protein, partial [Nannocystaceae bacterium]|nr:DUF1587 domain-containing protein [Nannocystaceae bacterium]